MNNVLKLLQRLSHVRRIQEHVAEHDLVTSRSRLLRLEQAMAQVQLDSCKAQQAQLGHWKGGDFVSAALDTQIIACSAAMLNDCTLSLVERKEEYRLALAQYSTAKTEHLKCVRIAEKAGTEWSDRLNNREQRSLDDVFLSRKLRSLPR